VKSQFEHPYGAPMNEMMQSKGRTKSNNGDFKDNVKHNRRLVVLVSLWLLVTFGYFLFRSSAPLLVWSDSPEVSANLYGSFGVGPRQTLNEQGLLEQIIRESFQSSTTTGYRPVNFIIHKLGVAFFSTPEASPYLWFAAVSLVCGTLAVCFFFVARRYTKTDLAAILAVILLLCSPSVVGSGWLIFSGIHALVLLLICLGLLLYWKILETPHNAPWYLAGLCAVLLLGPWYREFIGGLSVLIIFLEFQRARRPTPLVFLAGLFLLHAVFPTALVKLIAFPGLPLQPVFALGQLGVQVQLASAPADQSVIGHLIGSIRWRALFSFLALFPPTLVGLSLIGYLLPSGWRHDSLSFRSTKCGGGYLFLGFWLVVFFLPFLRIFTLHAHLAYPLMPFSIIVAAGAERLWQMTSHQTRISRILRNVVAVVLGVAICDHLLNLYGSYRTVRAINTGSLSVAEWFQKHIPEDSIVICNALHIEDIRLFSGGHIVPYWTVDTGIVELKRAVETPAKLERLLAQNNKGLSVYFLDVGYKFADDKLHYHSHKYVRNENVAMKEIGLVHTTRVRYPYLDPLRAFTPRPYILFLGGGDLENDFYHGPAQDGTPFMREIYAEYHVYQVTGSEVAPWDPNTPWTLVEDGYEGFNIFRYGDRYLALAQALGPVDLHWLNTRVVNDYKTKSAFFVGESVEELKGFLAQAPVTRRSDKPPEPILVHSGYRSFNIIRYGEEIYAIPQGQGAFEIERINRNEYNPWFSGRSLDEVQRLIDQYLLKSDLNIGR
jgi:hypothetical protein